MLLKLSLMPTLEKVSGVRHTKRNANPIPIPMPRSVLLLRAATSYELSGSTIGWGRRIVSSIELVTI